MQEIVESELNMDMNGIVVMATKCVVEEGREVIRGTVLI